MDAKEAIEQLKAEIKGRKLTGNLNPGKKHPQAGQLHRSTDPDWFYLVTEVAPDRVEIIPGSFEVLEAGPDDIVLPSSIFGDMFFLSLDLATAVPASALKDCFAIMDDVSYDRVIDSQIEYDTGEKGDNPSYPRALSYISRHDPRIKFHNKMAKRIHDEALKLVVFVP